MMNARAKNGLNVDSYPRTGKRGVPQQFPRRLYQMLESEAKLAATSNGEGNDIISWSDSGRAFRITNVSKFASEILPKYFRTSKFSSFQRNLNLYGFTKVRRGPDMDMYGHPNFIRGHAEMLALLRKSTSGAGRKSSGTTSTSKPRNIKPRAISPSPPGSPTHPRSTFLVQTNVNTASTSMFGSKFYLSDSSLLSQRSAFDPAKKGMGGTGRLDLLAMAITTLAEKDFD